MRKGLAVDDLGDLMSLPLLAVLATYRRDGTVLLSPVWHEWRDGAFQVPSRSDDVKVRHLSRDARASIVVCEHAPPYRGIEVRGTAQVTTAGAGEAVRRIASRYLGSQMGGAYADEGTDDVIVRLAPGEFRGWDFTDDFGRELT